MTAEAGGAAEKATLRRVILSELREMTPDDRAARSEVIRRHVVASAPWKGSERVLLFSPMRTEPDITALEVAAAESGKRVAVIPRTIRLEQELELSFTPDVILVPGLAFSPEGHRLGRGGGFYDRLLVGRAAVAFKIGICFRFQLRATVPFEEHDVVLDAVISD